MIHTLSDARNVYAHANKHHSNKTLLMKRETRVCVCVYKRKQILTQYVFCVVVLEWGKKLSVSSEMKRFIHQDIYIYLHEEI